MLARLAVEAIASLKFYSNTTAPGLHSFSPMVRRWLHSSSILGFLFEQHDILRGLSFIKSGATGMAACAVLLGL